MKQPHIAIEIPDFIPKEFDNEFLEELKHENLDLRFKRNGPIAYNAIEWVVPGLVAAYIFKPYFEAFLQEAGKDHYIILKSKIGELLVRSKELKVKTLTASQSAEKLDPTNTQSKAVSVHIQLKNGRLVKLLYDENLPIELWISATNEFLDLVLESYIVGDEHPLIKYLNQVSPEKGGTIYAYLDVEAKEWRLIYDLGYFLLSNRKK